uniref:Leucine rich colipase-like 1 n=1 Tax=Nannospalax galili TaxID=1026970 RepID=A0A8C6QB73_NANGA
MEKPFLGKVCRPSLEWVNRVWMFQGNGETCEHNPECQSDCCVTNSLNPQKFCTPQTMFLQCVPWKKPNGHLCEDHLECHSSCCIRTGYSPNRFCSAKTIFLQCPEGDKCQSHSECWSLCCLPVSETSPSHCTQRTGLLALCLPVVSPWQLGTDICGGREAACETKPYGQRSG